jgi:hypothetical protein
MLPNIRMYVARFHVSRQSRPTFGAPALSMLSAPSAPTRSRRSRNSYRVWGWLVRLEQRRGDTVLGMVRDCVYLDLLARFAIPRLLNSTPERFSDGAQY